MNRNGLSILIAILIFSLNPNTSNALEPDHTVMRFLAALKNGNIQVIKDSITGEMYNNGKVLLEHNESYSEFLKKIYRDAKFQIKETTLNDNEAIVKVESKSTDGKTRFIFYLNKNDRGNWKIFKESSAP